MTATSRVVTKAGGLAWGALLALGLALYASTALPPTTALAEQATTQGDFTVIVDDGDEAQYSFAGDVLSITGGTLTVRNVDPETPTSGRIEISGNADVTFDGVNIERSSSGSPVQIRDYADTNVTIRLRGENSLVSSASETAALRKTRGQSGGSNTSRLLITSAAGDGSYEGSLHLKATGSKSAAIGGNGSRGDVTDITIAGGTITASVANGSAIGATGGGSAWRMLISGGIVRTSGGDGLGANHDPGGLSEFQITGGFVVTNAYRGSTPSGGLVSTDGGESFTARGDCELPESQSPLSAKKLTVEEGATLTIPDEATMTVTGTAVNNGAVTGAGSLESQGTFYNNGTVGEGVVKGTVSEQLVTVESGTMDGSTEPQTIEAGSTVTIRANEVTGMVFSGWEVTMGRGVVLTDPASAETTFSMPAGSCVVVRANYKYLYGTIVTEEGERIPVTGNGADGVDSALDEIGWENYPNSTFQLTAPGETADDVSDYLGIPWYMPEVARIDLNGRTMSAYRFGSYEGVVQLTVYNGTVATDQLDLYDCQLILEDMTLSAGDGGDSLTISVVGANSSLTFGEGVTLSESASQISVIGYDSSVTIPCELAKDERLSFDDQVGVNRVHSWRSGTDGAETCSSCGLLRGSVDLSLSPAEGFVYDGESLTVDDMGVVATRGGVDCSDEVVFSRKQESPYETSRSGLPRDAGTYQITATLYGASVDGVAYETAAETVTVRVAPRPVTVHFDGTVSAQDKVYDGTAVVNLSGIDVDSKLRLEGVLERDEDWVWLRNPKGVFGECSDSNAGEKGVSVRLVDPRLTDQNYVLSSNEVLLETPVTATIEQRPVTFEWKGVTGRHFGDGRDVTADVANAVEGDDVFALVSGGDQHEVGTYTATAELAGSSAGNYVLAEGEKSVEYTIAPAIVTPDGTQIAACGEDGTPQTFFVFGDKIVVRIKPAFESAEQDASARAIIEPNPEQMALYYGGTQISVPASAAPDGWYTMTYDTGDGVVPAGSDSETLVARLVGSDNVGAFEASVVVSIAKAPQTAPEGVASTNEITVGDGGQLSGLPEGGEWRPSGEGAWLPVPEDGVVSGLPAGDYEVRLPGSETHDPSDAVTVTIGDFSSTHGNITYPSGTTDSGDGLAILPEGGGAVTFPNGSTVILPGGSTVNPEVPTATTPSGVVVTPIDGGLSVRLPGGAVVTAGSVTVSQDGHIMLPGGGTITYQDGTVGRIDSGETVAPDVMVPEREPDTPGSSTAEQADGVNDTDSEKAVIPQAGDVTAFSSFATFGVVGMGALAGAVALRRRWH